MNAPTQEEKQEFALELRNAFAEFNKAINSK
jgi:hypothetical protein